jgi:hypothetical protein
MPDGGRVRLAPVNGDGFRHAVAADGFGEKVQGGVPTSVLGEEEVNRLKEDHTSNDLPRKICDTSRPPPFVVQACICLRR